MGVLTAQYILDGAWTKANEQLGGAAVRWTAAEGLRWFNNGCREIVNQLPVSNPKVATPVLAANSRQDFAGLGITDGHQWLDVVRNMGTDGATPGKPTRKIERAILDDTLPTWHATNGAAVTNWVHNPLDPEAFYIYPRPPAGHRLEVVYAAIPAALASATQNFPLKDTYANALEALILYSFYSKDATHTSNPTVASAYWTLFQQMLGVRGQNLAGFAGAADRKANGGAA